MGEDRSLDIFADLHLEITDDRGFTHVHLNGGPDELVLDVDDPAVALRSGARYARGVQRLVPAGAFGGIRVLVRSGGRVLARIRVTEGGSIRARPTAAGVRVAGAVGAESGVVRGVLALVGAIVVAVIVAGRNRHD